MTIPLAHQKNAVNKRIYAKNLKFCRAAVFVVCQRDDHKTDFYYTIVILKNQGAYLMYSSIFLKKDSHGNQFSKNQVSKVTFIFQFVQITGQST